MLKSPDESRWLWLRVAGDALDIAVLCRALAGKRPGRAAVSLGVVLGVKAGDVWCALALRGRQQRAERIAVRTRLVAG